MVDAPKTEEKAEEKENYILPFDGYKVVFKAVIGATIGAVTMLSASFILEKILGKKFSDAKADSIIFGGTVGSLMGLGNEILNITSKQTFHLLNILYKRDLQIAQSEDKLKTVQQISR